MYKIPRIPTFSGLEGIDSRIQEIQTDMATNLSWLQYSFGLCQSVLKQDGEDVITIPVCYIDKRTDPYDMRVWLDDTHKSYSFWDIIGTPEFEYGDNMSVRKSPALTYNVACIVVVNLNDINSDWKVARSITRQRLLKYFNQTLRFKGSFLIDEMYEKDINQIFDGYDITDTLTILRDQYAAFRIEARVIFKQDATDCAKEYDDWFLPSLDELEQMHINLYSEGVGDFLPLHYQSSSEDSDTRNWVASFNSFWSPGAGLKSMVATNYAVRACRTFKAATDQYSLRDTGQAGGLIFYIDGTTYYEAYATDQSSGKAWSNITDVEIGTTGTAIGSGLANTSAIIGQAGHTDSAAKLCNDLN